MVPFDAVTGRDYIISQSGSVIILAGLSLSFHTKIVLAFLKDRE